MPLLAGQRLVAVDTETTGFDADDGHRLVEVATVTIDDGVLGETWSSLIAPGRPIPEDSTAVHGITNEMVAQAAPAAASAAELRRRCADRTLVFHNATFDLPFIEIFLRESGTPELWNPVVDTLGLARGLSGEGSRSLVALAVRFGLVPEDSHRAAGDARTTARLFLVLAGAWERERHVRSLAELAAVSQDAQRLGRRSGGAPRETPPSE